MIRFRPTRKQIFAIVSPTVGFLVLLTTMSWLLGRVHNMRQPTTLKVEIIKPIPHTVTEKPAVKSEKKPVKQKKPAMKKPAKRKRKPVKRDQARPKKSPKPVIRGRVAMGGKLPAITVYSEDDLIDYMKALYAKGCIFLVKSPLGKLFATYDPINGQVICEIPRDFRSYSPRSRVLAVYGESPEADRIIETAVQTSSMVMFPDESKIIALLSLNWEDTLLDAIASAADSLGIDPQNIDSADATFAQGRFILNHISLRGGGVISVNRVIQS